MAKSRRPNFFRPQQKKTSRPAPLQPVELLIDDLNQQGRGVARHQNKVVFVDNALPGERVLASISERHKRFDEATVMDMLDVSEQRIAPTCDVYQRCGGCQLQHANYPLQLDNKLERLRRVVGPHGVDGTSVETLESPPFGYRHRARIHYHNGILGYRSKASHALVNVMHCPLMNDALSLALADNRVCLLDFLSAQGHAEIVMASGLDERVGLRIIGDSKIATEQCAALAEALVAPAFLHSVKGKNSEWRNESEPALGYDLGRNVTLCFEPVHFTQANPVINRGMIQQCLAWLAPQTGEPIHDYFCGLGNFSLKLAAAGASVVGFDSGEAMIAAAREQAVEQGFASQLRYEQRDLFTANSLASLELPGKVLLDPPRAGAEAVCQQLAVSKSVHTIAYVSCDPNSLRRDLDILTAAGFKLDAAVMADMFPQTYHMESLVLLTRR